MHPPKSQLIDNEKATSSKTQDVYTFGETMNDVVLRTCGGFLLQTCSQVFTKGDSPEKKDQIWTCICTPHHQFLSNQ